MITADRTLGTSLTLTLAHGSYLTTSRKTVCGQRLEGLVETDDVGIGGGRGAFHAEETTNAKVLRQNGTHRA